MPLNVLDNSAIEKIHKNFIKNVDIKTSCIDYLGLNLYLENKDLIEDSIYIMSEIINIRNREWVM